MVNWCPGLGTVLANEEVTSDGRSERGNFPVFRKRLRQWMMRITAYSDRLLDDLDVLDWPDKVKTMQRNWIGRSTGASVLFDADAGDIEVFTTRPDTLFGATYLVLAPEHELVDGLTAGAVARRASTRGGRAAPRHPAEAVAAYRASIAAKSDLERQENKTKTGVFLGTYATNPANGQQVPVFIADYVLVGYGTGAIMAVPGDDQRDWEFATEFGLPIVEVIAGGDISQAAYTGDGALVNSGYLDGLSVDGGQGGDRPSGWRPTAAASARVEYKLRDWLFARQRYWGEPFPIVYDADGRAHPLPDSALPVELPDIAGLLAGAVRPRRRRQRAVAAAEQGHRLGARRTRPRRRAASPTPATPTSCRSGRAVPGTSCATPTRTTQKRSAPRRTRRTGWARGPAEHGPDDPGGVDLYVGGVEHAVLHLLYCRFWHKVLYDLGHVTSREPYRRLVNQGYIQAFAYTDARGAYVPAADVVERDGKFFLPGPRRRDRGDPGVRQDRQEPEELDLAGRDLRQLRRRHAAGLRDVDGTAGGVAAVGHQGRRRRATGSCSGCGGWSSTRTPASQRVADDERSTTRRCGSCTAPSPGCRRGLRGAAQQHRGGQADRVHQPPDQGGRHAPGGRWSRWC